jgi:hypothetical protein
MELATPMELAAQPAQPKKPTQPATLPPALPTLPAPAVTVEIPAGVSMIAAAPAASRVSVSVSAQATRPPRAGKSIAA